MKKMGLNEIRSAYLDFFREKDHLILKSYSLIPENDKSLLLVNAGMAPLKDYFTGEKKMSKNRASSSQRCIRTADIDRVGKTQRHGTFFEMLGNFSFGDYFKTEAIHWAWEFLTERLGIEKDRLWATVYLDDDEAYNIWKDQIGVPEERILRFGKEDNFWELEEGPCGPCSEIYVDRGPKWGPEGKPGDEGDRYMEVWNLVFTQFNKDKEGNYTPLPNPNIDTGMGLERITVVMEDCANLFEIELMQNIIKKIGAIAGVSYGEFEKNDISMRIISDHSRAVTFLVSDGVVPSNEGRGYVLRRLIRRALRHGKLLGIQGPFLTQIVEQVMHSYESEYPELLTSKDRIFKIVRVEEDKFQETVDLGLGLLNRHIDELKAQGKSLLSGQDAFKLYDTYGFPLDLTSEILADEGMSVDEEAFTEAMQAQRIRSREARQKDSGFHQKMDLDYTGLEPTLFVGYDAFNIEAEVLALYKDGDRVSCMKSDEEGIMVLNRTSFYGEGGGQIGDNGRFKGAQGSGYIEDTTKTTHPFYLHHITVEDGEIKEGDLIDVRVDVSRRRDIMKNHSATHLLHQALRQVVGDHVHQAGSYVDDQRLRFDVTHYEAISPEDLEKVEKIVNRKIFEELPVVVREMSLPEAEAMGAIGLFEDKYQDVVRVVSMGDFSTELCGGTHLNNTIEVQMFKIVSEQSVAAGVRRIEAVTGRLVYKALKATEGQVDALAGLLKTKPRDLQDRLAQVLSDQAETERELKKLKQASLSTGADDLLSKAQEIKGVKALFARVDGLEMDALRNLGDMLKDKMGSGVVVLATTDANGVKFVSMVTKDLVGKKVHAGNLVRTVAQATGGKGGGRPDSASAGGKDVSKIQEAFEAGAEALAAMLN